MSARKLLVDIHTHVYLPRYANVLRARQHVPRILERTNVNGSKEERLVIFENEPISGRPVGPQYWDLNEKLKFMNKHEIDISFISSANPWLDFLSPNDAHSLAKDLNADLDGVCKTAPKVAGNTSLQRFYAFGLLPLCDDIAPDLLLESVKQIASLPNLKGIIMGSRGVGSGLDDERLEPVWAALAKAGLVVFLHPHYGVGTSAFGAKDNGHVLPLALGFPFETTTAITRLILAGVLDRHPSLRILLAHSGGVLPQLSSRLASCIDHDPVVAGRLQHDARYYMGRLYYDAVAYGPEELGFVSDIISRADAYASSAELSARVGAADRSLGSKRILFGTDHPFFPPLQATDKWRSVVDNLDAIEGVQGWSEADKDGVRGGNALRVFGLTT